MAAVLANGAGVLAEVDVRVEGRAALVERPLAEVVVELPEVAHAGGLDGAAAPPAAALHVSAPLRVRQIARQLPAANLDALVVLAAAAVVDVLEVLVQRHVVVERLHAPALGGGRVPARGLGYLGSRRAEQPGRRAPPAGLVGGANLHVRVHLARHLAAGELVQVWGARVILVRLASLPAGGGGRVPWSRPVVLVARVVLDGLLHALCQERCHVHKPVADVLRVVTKPELEAANAVRGHHAHGLDQVRPGVHV
mmetsp:Transcript_40174/g.119083  ORF Transcript_40174/g.119083 Transcript_40174/m.119083 type:complete len:253 (+) Transcript_40174:440-1198(+)